jgi:hypothetical protein
MIETTTARLVRVVAAAALAAAVFAGLCTPAAAGGWAVATLDSVPVARPGATTEVSFTILQHGTRPADLDEGVGIEIRFPDGGDAFHPAIRDGAGGHYVATVTFPDTAGTYEWRVRMGWFGPYDLGTLEVRAADSVADGAWSTIRWPMLAGGALLAGAAVANVLGERRRGVAAELATGRSTSD